MNSKLILIAVYLELLAKEAAVINNDKTGVKKLIKIVLSGSGLESMTLGLEGWCFVHMGYQVIIFAIIGQ